MFVINRKNQHQPIRYDKITDRNIELSKGLNVDPTYLSKLVIESLKSGMTTSEIDELSAETAFYMSTYEPDYDILATRISVSNLHKQTSSSFYETVKKMYEHTNNGKKSNVISDEFMAFVEGNKETLDNKIDYSRDFNYNYFGFKTLTRIYLNKLSGKVVERPQHMIMRVAVGIHSTSKDGETSENLNKIFESYEEMSLGKFTHASPTLFNSGSARAQLASCFLLKCEDDLEHIYETNKRSALISKYGGGIGIDISNIRCKGSVINANNGKSDGLVPMCKVFNATANYANQQSRRKGSIAMYLQPWHPDVMDFLALRYNNPPEELRARDLFTAMWIPDIFMQRVEKDEIWSLFDPNVVRELCDTYGDEFDEIYKRAELEGKYVKQLKAREVWKEIIHSQQETGLPYIAYKDSVNRKSNQKNIGLIRSSNLCIEINEFTDTNSVAVCNLASLSLPSFVKDGKFDFMELGKITKIAVRNLNKVIDITYYPVEEAKNNNLSYRPIGLGIQGLADVFAMFRVSWGSELATKLNRLISEVMYYYALEASHEIAMEEGTTYSAFLGSPISEGILQCDMWGNIPLTTQGIEILGHELKLDWEALRNKCRKGVRNSLLIALMPTATSSQILGNNECFEPFTSNIYTRSTISGDFIMVNKHLAKHLKELGLWDKDMVNRIIEANGSVQGVEEIPREVREIYKTVWEISQKIVVDYAADRGSFVDQSQSMNIFIEQPSYAKLSSMHLYGWKKGLKTGSYYIRSKPSSNAVKFSIMSEKKEENSSSKKYMLNGKEMICTEEVCVACSS
jgi:ribonucleoside-diphosphate reductase alpha chain